MYIGVGTVLFLIILYILLRWLFQATANHPPRRPWRSSWCSAGDRP